MATLNDNSGNDEAALRRALRRMPSPQPPAGFVDRVLANAVAAHATAASRATVQPNRVRQFFTRWETWAGAVLGGAVAAALALVLLRPVDTGPAEPVSVALALNEVRNIDVVIDAERDMQDATIRVAVIGSVALDGFGSEPEIGWHANLERGNNVLTLPVVARQAGAGQLIATIEHQGRTRKVSINLNVRGADASQS
jgi:hypothetical protein